MLSAVLRCLAIGRFSLGNDEIEEVRWSALPSAEMLRVASADGAHPPLEFLVQAGLTRAGAPEWVRRLPGAIAGTLTVALLVFVATRWFGRGGGLATGLLLACSPIHVRFSQEVRPYSIALLFLVAAVAALEQHRRTPAKRLAFAWFVAVLGAAYTLYFAGMVGVVVSVAFLFAYRRAGLAGLWRRLPLVLAGWIVLYLPWLPFVLGVAGRTPPVERERLDRAWLTYRLQVLGTGDWQVEPISLGSSLFWLLAALGIALAWRRRAALVAAVWLLGGGALELLILQLRPHFPAVRHLLPSWLGAVLLAGFAVSEASRRRIGRALAWASIAVVLAFDVRTLRDYYDHGRPRWNDVAAYLRSRVGDGDHVVVASGWAYRNLGYYWTDQRLGKPGVPLERPAGEVSGPSWIVLAMCPLNPEVQAQIDQLPLVGAFPTTNHCEIRFLPRDQRLPLPQGFCARDI